MPKKNEKFLFLDDPSSVQLSKYSKRKLNPDLSLRFLLLSMSPKLEISEERERLF